MALDLDLSTSSTIEVVSSRDSALNCSDEDYGVYLTTLEPSTLTFKDGCSYEDTTRFVLRKNLRFDQMQRIKNQQVSYKAGAEVEINVGYMLEEVRCALVDVLNPTTVPELKQVRFKKDKDGACDKDLVAALERAGIVAELFRARNSTGHSETDVEGLKKK